jgi:hypothetical protein
MQITHDFVSIKRGKVVVVRTWVDQSLHALDWRDDVGSRGRSPDQVDVLTSSRVLL